MSCLGCEDFEQKKVFCTFCRVTHLEGICKRNAVSFLAPVEGVRCEHYKNTCDHEWVRTTYTDSSGGQQPNPPYWWDDEAIAVDVFCAECGARGVELWIYSHTQKK